MSADSAFRLFKKAETGPRRIAGVPASLVLLIAAIVGAHAYRTYLPDNEGHQFLLRLAFFPLDFSDPHAAARGGTAGPGAVTRLWTAVSYVFVHTGWLQVAVYSLWMLAFSGVVVQRLGTQRFLILCVACAIAGAGAHLATHWQQPVLLTGAAAMISGHVACAIRFLFARPSNLLQARRMHPEHLQPERLGAVLIKPAVYVFLGIWAGIFTAFSLTSTEMAGFASVITWQAPVGGFIAGLLLFPLLDVSRP